MGLNNYTAIQGRREMHGVVLRTSNFVLYVTYS